MLLGESVQRLDVKNRLTLPAKLRAHFAHGVVVSKGFDGCLFVFSPDGWERYVDSQLGRLDPLSRRGREMSRWLYGGASETELDRQGRVMLPPAQIAHAGLEKDIVVAGLRDHLEIWDLTAWRKREAEFEGSVEDVAESLAQQQ
ncbi:MAG TPA: division/cell wall cluster transcriptional repressor MraZ [Gaiellales bacterium]|jgi:MraZ protein|nr:division/cell wall cluster transcriptional repressor MraZ [Gaiellales bacterium]